MSQYERCSKERSDEYRKYTLKQCSLPIKYFGWGVSPEVSSYMLRELNLKIEYDRRTAIENYNVLLNQGIRGVKVPSDKQKLNYLPQPDDPKIIYAMRWSPALAAYFSHYRKAYSEYYRMDQKDYPWQNFFDVWKSQPLYEEYRKHLNNQALLKKCLCITTCNHVVEYENINDPSSLPIYDIHEDVITSLEMKQTEDFKSCDYDTKKLKFLHDFECHCRRRSFNPQSLHKDYEYENIFIDKFNARFSIHGQYILGSLNLDVQSDWRRALAENEILRKSGRDENKIPRCQPIFVIIPEDDDPRMIHARSWSPAVDKFFKTWEKAYKKRHWLRAKSEHYFLESAKKNFRDEYDLERRRGFAYTNKYDCIGNGCICFFRKDILKGEITKRDLLEEEEEDNIDDISLETLRDCLFPWEDIYRKTSRQQQSIESEINKKVIPQVIPTAFVEATANLQNRMIPPYQPIEGNEFINKVDAQGDVSNENVLSQEFSTAFAKFESRMNPYVVHTQNDISEDADQTELNDINSDITEFDEITMDEEEKRRILAMYPDMLSEINPTNILDTSSQSEEPYDYKESNSPDLFGSQTEHKTNDVEEMDYDCYDHSDALENQKDYDPLIEHPNIFSLSSPKNHIEDEETDLNFDLHMDSPTVAKGSDDEDEDRLEDDGKSTYVGGNEDHPIYISDSDDHDIHIISDEDDDDSK